MESIDFQLFGDEITSFVNAFKSNFKEMLNIIKSNAKYFCLYTSSSLNFPFFDKQNTLNFVYDYMRKFFDPEIKIINIAEENIKHLYILVKKKTIINFFNFNSFNDKFSFFKIYVPKSRIDFISMIKNISKEIVLTMSKPKKNKLKKSTTIEDDLNSENDNSNDIKPDNLNLKKNSNNMDLNKNMTNSINKFGKKDLYNKRDDKNINISKDQLNEYSSNQYSNISKKVNLEITNNNNLTKNELNQIYNLQLKYCVKIGDKEIELQISDNNKKVKLNSKKKLINNINSYNKIKNNKKSDINNIKSFNFDNNNEQNKELSFTTSIYNDSFTIPNENSQNNPFDNYTSNNEYNTTENYNSNNNVSNNVDVNENNDLKDLIITSKNENIIDSNKFSSNNNEFNSSQLTIDENCCENNSTNKNISNSNIPNHEEIISNNDTVENIDNNNIVNYNFNDNTLEKKGNESEKIGIFLIIKDKDKLECNHDSNNSIINIIINFKKNFENIQIEDNLKFPSEERKIKDKLFDNEQYTKIRSNSFDKISILSKKQSNLNESIIAKSTYDKKTIKDIIFDNNLDLETNKKIPLLNRKREPIIDNQSYFKDKKDKNSCLLSEDSNDNNNTNKINLDLKENNTKINSKNNNKKETNNKINADKTKKGRKSKKN